MTDLPTAGARRPSPDLEDRVVRRLRAEGLLSDGGRRNSGAARWLAAAAAAALLFVGGYAAGQRSGAQTAVDLVRAVRDGDAAARAEQVQRTGSLYVQAVNALGGGAPGSETVPDAGREVALATLRAAVAELVRLYPSDAVLRQSLDLLSTPSGSTDASGAESRSLLWF